MKNWILIAATPLALAACGGNDVDAPEGENVDITVAENGEVALGNETSAVAGTPYADTAWEYLGNDGTTITTSLRSDGSYQDSGGGEVRDQGTWSWKDGQVCYDSVMENDNDQCWDGPPQPIAVGQSYVTNSETGMSMEMKRVRYAPVAKEAPGT